MRERAELSLKILCWVLVAVLLWQLKRAIDRNHPFAHVTIPTIPTLAAATNATSDVASTGPATAKMPVNMGTNQVHPGTNGLGTNLVMQAHSTNRVATTASNSPPMNSNSAAMVVNSSTNLAPPTAATNLGTNLPPVLAAVPVGTNVPAMIGSNQMGTNTLTAMGAHKKSSKSHRPPMAGMGMGMGMGGFMPGMGMGAPLPDLPPKVRALVDQIVNSELLGPVFHPQPKALMGIAGDVAFLRTDSGQTGMVKVGDTLGDLKLVRIGINRVLVEQNGQPQELTIFNGMGGESLITTPDKNSNETTNHVSP